MLLFSLVSHAAPRHTLLLTTYYSNWYDPPRGAPQKDHVFVGSERPGLSSEPKIFLVLRPLGFLADSRKKQKVPGEKQKL